MAAAASKNRGRWVVVQYGWEGADGASYGIGQPATTASRLLVSRYPTEAEAQEALERVREAERAELGKWWLPGDRRLKALYEVRRYCAADYVSEQEFRDDRMAPWMCDTAAAEQERERAAVTKRR